MKTRTPRVRALPYALALACVMSIAGLDAPLAAATTPGPLAPARFAIEPAHVPPPAAGHNARQWARCASRRPAGQVVPYGIDPRGVDPAATNPLLGLTYFVDRMEPAYREWARYRRAGRPQRASMLWRLAREPRFRWFGKWSRPSVARTVRGYLNRVRCDQPGTVPFMVVMRHQGRSCAPGYTGGGPREDRATRRWYRRFARAVGGRRVVIGFEPDSLGTIDCLARRRRDDRLRLLRYGVKVLSKLPRATIYLEGGAADWEPARRTARQLRAIGIRRVRGFMVNVTHHDWTRASIRHGLDISRRVGGKPFVVNTSYNGRGPVHWKRWINRGRGLWRRMNVWCNPGLRGLGPPPTTLTSHTKVDAYLYINRPGYSAGRCNGGPMPVGSWWPRRALMYSRLATHWESPPPGTRHGLFKRVSLRQLGAFGR